MKRHCRNRKNKMKLIYLKIKALKKEKVSTNKNFRVNKKKEQQ